MVSEDELARKLVGGWSVADGPIANPFVTVVVPMYNEADCIRECVLSLLKQNFAPLEVVVVDDGSTDESVRICEDLKVAVLRQDHRGPGAARNLGVRNARGNILVFVDADMVFARDYVAMLVTPIVRGEAVATCHWDEFVLNWENRWSRCESYYLGRPGRRRQPAEPPEGEAVYRAVRKDFFLGAGGFAENEGRGDDISIALRTGVLAKIVRGAVCYHRGPESLKEAVLEAAWHGRNVCIQPEARIRRTIAALVSRNVVSELYRWTLRGIRLREPWLPLYAAGYSLGFSYGIVHGIVTRRYVK